MFFGPAFIEENPSVLYNNCKEHLKAPMKVFIVHGANDWVCTPKNSIQIAQQWVFTNNYFFGGGKLSQRILRTPSDFQVKNVPKGYLYQEYQYSDSETGLIYIRHWKVNDMGHAISGGDPRGSYTEPKGPDASLFMINWFLGLDKSLTHHTQSCEADGTC